MFKIIENFRYRNIIPYKEVPDEELIPGWYYTIEILKNNQKWIKNKTINWYNKKMLILKDHIQNLSKDTLYELHKKIEALNSKINQNWLSKKEAADILCENFHNTFSSIYIPEWYSLGYKIRKHKFNIVTWGWDTIDFFLKKRKNIKIYDGIYIKEININSIYEFFLANTYIHQFNSNYGRHSRYDQFYIIDFPVQEFVKKYNSLLWVNGWRFINCDISTLNDHIPKISIKDDLTYIRVLAFNAWIWFYHHDFFIKINPAKHWFKMTYEDFVSELKLNAIVPFHCGIIY